MIRKIINWFKSEKFKEFWYGKACPKCGERHPVYIVESKTNHCNNCHHEWR